MPKKLFELKILRVKFKVGVTYHACPQFTYQGTIRFLKTLVCKPNLNETITIAFYDLIKASSQPKCTHEAKIQEIQKACELWK
jgi:hypothetical protein